MAGRWYESRTIQAAAISAVILGGAGVIAAIITAGNRAPAAAATFDIKTLGEGGEQTLARLAMRPTSQLVDSNTFSQLSHSFVVNESVGVAFERPEGQDWTVGPLGSLQSIDLLDLPFMAAWSDMDERGWPRDTTKTHVRSFGTKRDHAVTIRLDPKCAVDSVELGVNPFTDVSNADAWIRSGYGDQFDKLPSDSIRAYRAEILRWMDSVITKKLPATKQLYSGVFVARVTDQNFPTGFVRVILRKIDFIEKVAGLMRSGLAAPTMLILDRERGYVVLNETMRLTNVSVNGQEHTDLIVNRVGYAVVVGDAVAYVVMLQYVSADPPEALTQLQNVFQSIRLRGSPSVPR